MALKMVANVIKDNNDNNDDDNKEITLGNEVDLEKMANEVDADDDYDDEEDNGR